MNIDEFPSVDFLPHTGNENEIIFWRCGRVLVMMLVFLTVAHWSHSGTDAIAGQSSSTELK